VSAAWRTAHRSSAEWRDPDRPLSGDIRPCPSCGTGQLEFNERYRLDGQPTAAWLCDNAACGFHEILGPETRPRTRAELLRASRQTEARAKRIAMKARAQVARLKKGIAISKARLLGSRNKS
jgi:hypothetical protein